ncbi:helix-turn-helix domain-containing protein, partial [Blastococcus deserti]
MTGFDLPGTLRRIRRLADRSQRELAVELELSKSAIAAAESGRRDLPVSALARAAALAGLRLALLDADGAEVAGMAPDAVRD